jgi:hypothetical protein
MRRFGEFLSKVERRFLPNQLAFPTFGLDRRGENPTLRRRVISSDENAIRV